MSTGKVYLKRGLDTYLSIGMLLCRLYYNWGANCALGVYKLIDGTGISDIEGLPPDKTKQIFLSEVNRYDLR